MGRGWVAGWVAGWVGGAGPRPGKAMTVNTARQSKAGQDSQKQLG